MPTDFDTSTPDGRVTFRADNPDGTGWLTLSVPNATHTDALELLAAALNGELRARILPGR